ncbi:MAG TPA: hypothetical protein VGQ36_27935 [Thermoanaerobaculia bacterium]|jgi:hypothetical protein|nr:hypothetical protein [Thermoanaerobaculia bacterium]
MRIRATLLILLAAAAPTLAANQFSDFYVIPAAGHVNGRSGTTWQSDIIIYNFQSTPITVEMAVVDTGVRVFDNVSPIQPGGASTITVAPGATLTLADVLNDHRGRAETMGAILIGADQPFAVVSRLFAVMPSGSTIGQTVSPVSDFLDNVGFVGPGVAFVPGLAANARFRTNLGFLAAVSSGAPLVLEVSLAGRTGAAIGTTRTFAIPAGALAHLFFSSTVLAGVFDEGVARFRIVSGSGAVAPFASVIENSSNNAMFLNGGFPPGTSTTSGSASFFREVLRSAQ